MLVNGPDAKLLGSPIAVTTFFINIGNNDKGQSIVSNRVSLIAHLLLDNADIVADILGICCFTRNYRVCKP